MHIERTSLEGVLSITPVIHRDKRGYFFESYRKSVFKSLGLPANFVQDNQAYSQKGVLRGLHYQLKYPQGKLVRVTFGRVYDVAVDVRRGSPTFGTYHAEILSAENHRMVYIPQGYAHGYCVLSETAIFQYKCTQVYHSEDEYGIRWDDPAIGIEWPLDNVSVSAKDEKFPCLAEAVTDNLPLFGGVL